MAELKRIPHADGSVTIISDSYGESVVRGPASRPEDPSRWKITWLREPETKQLCGLNDAQFETARAYLGFPEPRIVQTTDWFPKRFAEWKEDNVRTWLGRMRSLNL
jgi:hypothetical protein